MLFLFILQFHNVTDHLIHPVRSGLVQFVAFKNEIYSDEIDFKKFYD